MHHNKERVVDICFDEAQNEQMVTKKKSIFKEDKEDGETLASL